jgi:hypothetical protein
VGIAYTIWRIDAETLLATITRECASADTICDAGACALCQSAVVEYVRDDPSDAVWYAGVIREHDGRYTANNEFEVNIASVRDILTASAMVLR